MPKLGEFDPLTHLKVRLTWFLCLCVGKGIVWQSQRGSNGREQCTGIIFVALCVQTFFLFDPFMIFFVWNFSWFGALVLVEDVHLEREVSVLTSLSLYTTV